MKINLAVRNAIIIASIGIVMTILVGYVEFKMKSTFERNAPYVKLTDYLKNSVTQSQLRLEQGIDGATDVDYKKDVVTGLANSKKILQSVMDGQETELGKFWAPDDEETIAILKKSIIELENLMALADQRWEARNQTTVEEQPVFESDSMAASAPVSTAPSGPSPLDLQFNSSYSGLLLTFDGLTEHVNEKIKADANFLSIVSWISVALIFVIFSLVGFFMYRILNRNEKLVVEGKQKLDQEIQRVDTLSNFIQAVSAGDYSIEIESTDDLSNRLITMRDTLRNNAEEDKRRNWATSGEAQIGEILRASGNITELYDNIITFVVKYTKSNQGGLFILNDENEQDIYLELVSCYAFERKKFIKKRVDIGQGLIGQCFMEGARIHLREIPADYVHITSGLGGASPTSLLVIPMKVNEKTYGVIELASFKKYEEHEIVLIEKFAESIGAEVSSVKSNESTRILLEKTQQQTEEMRAQEEEMRQNMEELEATQEEMRRKEKHIQNMLDEEVMKNQEAEKGRKVVLGLTKNNDIQSGRWDKGLEIITSSIAKHLQVSRCSVWSYNDKEHKIVSEKLYQADTNSYEAGVELFGKDFPGYFSAVLREETIIAQDAHTHPATKEFSSVYLTPLNIESLFDVPIFNEGKIFGVICCEHQFNQKTLSDDQVEFLKSCADLVTICYKTKRLNELAKELETTKS